MFGITSKKDTLVGQGLDAEDKANQTLEKLSDVKTPAQVVWGLKKGRTADAVRHNAWWR
jgi:hypothetical protein